MYKQIIKIDPKTFELIADKAINGPKEVFRQYGNSVAAIGNQTVAVLSADPGPVVYPIQWSTERQRRAFFATNGFGRGIPTGRTGKYLQAWEWNARTTQDGGIFEVENTAQTANHQSLEQFVQGARQQPFHRNTGYVPTQPTLNKAGQEAELLLATMWQDIMGEL